MPEGWQTVAIVALIILFFIVLALRKNLARIFLKSRSGDEVVIETSHASEAAKQIKEDKKDVESGYSKQSTNDIVLDDKYDSHKVLKRLNMEFQRIQGNHLILYETDENYRVASLLYSESKARIISTCFFEDPDYGDKDLARNISRDVTFTRVTIRDLCDDLKERKIENQLNNLRCHAKLTVIENSVELTKLSGIFMKFNDGSHITFTSLLRHQKQNSENVGLVLCGDVAKVYYDYYEGFIK